MMQAMMLALSRLYQRYRSSIVLVTGSWYLIAALAQRAITLLSYAIFANLLTAEELGVVAVFNGWVAIFASVLTFNVAASITNARFEFDAAAFRRFVSSVLTLGLIGCALAAPVLLLMPESWVDALFGIDRPLVLLAVVAAAAYLPRRVASDIWNTNYQHARYNLVNLLTTVYIILLSIVLILVPPIFVAAYDRAIGRILGTVIGYTVFGVVLLGRKLIDGRTLFSRRYWAYALGISLPLIAYTLSRVLVSRADQLMLNQYMGTAETGVYSLAYQFGEITQMLFATTNSVWWVWFYRQMSAQDERFIPRRAHQYALGFAAINVLLILIGPVLIRALTPQPYWRASAVVPVVMAGGFFAMLAEFYAGVEFYLKRTTLVAAAMIISAAANIGLNVILLPRYGFLAAAWTTLVSYALVFVLHAAFVTFVLRKGRLFSFPLLAGLGVAITLLAAVVFFVAGSATGAL